MDSYTRAMPWLLKMQNRTFLTPCWHSFSWWGDIYVMRCFGWKGCHYLIYKLLPHSNTLIGQDAKPKIVDAPLTFIFIMQQGVWRYRLCPWRWPILHLWMFTTNQQSHYPKRKTKNRWRSINAQFQEGAGSAARLLLPPKAANTWLRDVCNQSPVGLPKMQDHKCLTLCWRWFSGYGREPVAIVFAPEGSPYPIYGWLQPIATYDAQDAKPESVDPLLMLIFRMGHWLCCYLFCLQRLPIQRLCITAT